MTHQTDLDNHANQLNPNNDAYYESRGEDGRPDDWSDGGSSRRYDDDDYGTDGPGLSSESRKDRPQPKTRTAHVTCAACRKEADMLAETVETSFGQTWERSRCPLCGVSVSIQGSWAMQLIEGTAQVRADEVRPPASEERPAEPGKNAGDVSLQNAVIAYLSEAGHDNLPTWALYGALGVQSREPSYSTEEFETFLDDMVARRLILGDKVFRIQRYV